MESIEWFMKILTVTISFDLIAFSNSSMTANHLSRSVSLFSVRISKSITTEGHLLELHDTCTIRMNVQYTLHAVMNYCKKDARSITNTSILQESVL